MTELRMTEEAKRRVIRMNIMFAWIFVLIIGGTQIPLQLIMGNWGFALFILGVVVAMVLFTYLLANRMVRQSRIVFGDGTYTLYGFGRTKRFTVADVARVVTINDMVLGAGVAGGGHYLIVTGPAKRLLMMVGQMWGMGQLSAIALDLANRGVPLTPIPQPITPVQLRAYDRRLMPAWQAHPIAFGLLVGLGVLVIMVVVVVVVLAFVLPQLLHS